MKTENLARYFFQVFMAATLLIIPAAFYATPLPQSQPNIVVTGNLRGDKAPPGRAAQAVVVMDIPSGFHVHSNRPLEKFLIATQLQIEAP
jgi:hypothetical protein